jgi:hypothetical protein
METVLIAAIGNAIGGIGSAVNGIAGAYGKYFGVIEAGRWLKVEEKANETVYIQSIFGYQTAVTASEANKIKTGMIAVAIMGMVLIIAIAIASKNKK